MIPAEGLLKASHDEDPISSNHEEMVRVESSCSIACQVFIPFMIAGMGTVAAGLLLDIVQVSEIY